MKGDFSRFTFNPLQNYTAVLKQQGRVDLDSDWNEQAEIINECIRQAMADIIGPFGIPKTPNNILKDNSQALKIDKFTSGPGNIIDFSIGRGQAYIGGHLWRLPMDVSYSSQPDYPEPELLSVDGDILVFIEAWQRSICYIDDDLIRDSALGGPDTGLRSRLVGQIKIMPVTEIDTPVKAVALLDSYPENGNLLLTLQIDQSAHQLPIGFGEIEAASGMIPGNMHYRLEIHRGMTGSGGQSEGVKWSDENGAVAVKALKSVDNRSILVEELEQITGESLKLGDWVEVTNLVTELRRQGGQMAKITGLESVSGGLQVTLDSDIHPLLTRRRNGLHSGLDQGLAPRLRRWSGYISPLSLKTVYDLGRGIKAVFGATEKKPLLESSDYWTFAVRDRDYNKHYAPQKAAPQGIRKYRYPLAIIKRDKNGNCISIIDCRKFFKSLAS